MWWKDVIMGFVGAAAGFGLAGGIFAFILSLKVVPRLAEVTGTAAHITLYEDSLLMGGLLGNLYYLFVPAIPMGVIWTSVIGLFSGAFIGCVAIAIAEAINVIPIMFRRINLQKGLGLVILSLALGKGLGAWLQLALDWKK